MKKSIFIAAMATILPFCGYAATKTVSVGTFNAIKVNSYVNVAFTQGKSASPEINAITINGSGDFTTSDLTSTNLEININGSGSFTANRINTSTATAKVNGSGEISIKSLKSTNTETDVNGSGEITVKGGPKHVQSKGKKPNM